jgi:hypothetical protein
MDEHPIAHVPDEIAHQWMREDCAALDAARQAREDNLMNVIIQTSSAAVLAIPGLFIAADVDVPKFKDAWPIYVGTLAFALAFAGACIEQVLSGKAYEAQKRVVEKYYSKKSPRTSDQRAIGRADLARNVALAIFAVAVSLGALGLAQFARGSDGKAASSSAQSVPSSVPGTDTTDADAPAVNSAASTVPRNKVEPGNNSTAASVPEERKVK